jgi:hypothetical protein
LREAWRHLLRKGVTIARCTVERPMRAMELADVRHGQSCVATVPDRKAPCRPATPGYGGVTQTTPPPGNPRGIEGARLDRSMDVYRHAAALWKKRAAVRATIGSYKKRFVKGR